MYNRKSLLLLVVFTLLVGIIPSGFIVPSNVKAETNAYTEVPEGYIGIYTMEDLNSIRNNLSGKYILINDLDLTAAVAEGGIFHNTGNGWVPIGTEAAPFTGVIDGNGHKINGLRLSIHSDQKIYAGFIGYAKNAQIKNLGMEDNIVSVKNTSFDANTADAFAGGIVGYGYNVTITNSYNTGTITADSMFKGYSGGIAGYVEASYNQFSTITGSYNTGTVSAKTSVGGIAGKTYRTNLSDVYNLGSFSGDLNKNAGGIVGELWSDSSITNAYNKGAIQYWTRGGGIAGESNRSSISHSHNDGDLSSTVNSSTGGGIVSYASNSVIENTFNTGKISGSAEYTRAGGIAGTLSTNSSLVNSYNNADISGDGAVGGIVGYLGSSVTSETYNTGTISGFYAGGVTGSSSGGTILDSYNIGSIKGEVYSGGIAGDSDTTALKNTFNVGFVWDIGSYGRYSGGIAGKLDGTIENSFYLENIQNGVDSGDQSGTSKKTLEEMNAVSTFAGFDFIAKWTFHEGGNFKFPTLRTLPAPVKESEKNVDLAITTSPNKVNYFLGEDLDLSGAFVTLTTNHGNQLEKPITEEMVSGYYPNQKGTQSVRVSYEGMAEYFMITVQAKFTATFKDHDGTVLKTESVLEGANATAPVNPTREGYTFTGWDKSFSNVTSNITVTAKYEMITYKVTYKDGDNVYYSEEHSTFSTVTPPSIPMKSGYTFLDWYEDAQFLTKYQFFNHLSKDITLYGKFTSNPAPPQNVTVVSTGYDELKMTWNPSTEVNGYEIQGAESPNGPYNHFYGANGNEQGYKFIFLEPGKTYYFKVRSYRMVDDHKVYSPLTPVVSAAPVYPKANNVKAVPSGLDKITISWDEVNRSTAYEIYRATSINGNYVKIGFADNFSPITYTDEGLSTEATYYYKVRGYRGEIGKTFYGPFSDPVSAKPAQFVRFGGVNRYEVQAKFNQDIPDYSLDYVIVTSGLKFPDALSSGVLNNKLNSTTLLVQDNASIVQSKISEAKRLLKPGGKVLIVGGTGTVSTSIEEQFKKYFSVERIGGSDRIAVSVNIANRVDNNPEEIFLTYGLVFSDSLSIVPYAAKANIPIVLQYGNGLNDQVEKYLQSHPSIKKVTIVSGTGVIPVSIEKELRSLGVSTVERVAGQNRYDTSLLIAKKYFPHATEVALSNGFVFADALSGSRFAFKKDMPIILVQNNNAIYETREFVKGLKLTNVYLYGGPGTINDSIKAVFQ